MPTVRTRRKSLYGYPGTNIFEAPEPIIADRAPTTSDGAELGQLWIDTSANDFRILCDNTSGSFTWTGTTGGATTLTSLTVNPGNLVVTAGDATVSAGTTTVQDLVVNAGATITGNVGITGNLSLTGDFDLSGPDAFSIVSTSNTDPAIYLHVNGGVAEVLRLRSSQGTSADSIDLDSVAGGITLTAGLVSDDAINFESSGGIDMDAAMQISIASSENAADAIVLNASAGGLDILAAGGAGEDIDVLNTAGSINLIAGEAAADAVVISAGDAAGGVNITSGSNAVNVNDSVNQPTNINTGTSTGAVSIGNAAAGAITVDTAAGISLTADNVSNFTVTAAGQDLALASNLGSVSLSSGEDVAGCVTISASGGTSETILINSTAGTGADSINLLSDAGGITLTSNLGTDSGINLNAVGGGVDIDGALQVNIASSEAAADAVSIRATDAAGGIVLDAGGIVSVAPDVASVASPTASSTQNFRVIRTIFTGFTTAAAASQDFTIVSSDILATSGILVQVTNFDGGNAAVMTMDGVTQSVGQIVVHTTNNGAGALDANVIVTVWVLS